MSVTRHRVLRSFGAPVIAVAAVLGIAAQAMAATPETVVRHDQHHAAFPLYDCGDFVVAAEWDVSVTMTMYLDSEGNVRGVKGHVSYAGTMSHPTNGRWVDDRGVHTWTENWISGTVRDAGGYRKITAPGAGLLIHDTGLSVIAYHDPFDPFDDEQLKLAGPKDELEGKTDALCAYLRG